MNASRPAPDEGLERPGEALGAGAPGPPRSSRPPDPSCPNCGTATGEARYCPTCGQSQGALVPTVGAWLGQALEDLVFVEGRLPRTLGRLMWPPGELTAEWRRGRRASYVHPLRTYLLSAAIFFLAWTLTPDNRMMIGFAVHGVMEQRGALPTYADSRYEPLQPLSPNEAGDTLARARWRAEYDTRRALQRSATADIDARVRAGVQRITDLLPLLIGVLLVPVLASLTFATIPARSSRGSENEGAAVRPRFMEHLVLSTHTHSVGYFLLAAAALLGAVSPSDVGLMLWFAGFAATTVYLLAAVRRNFGAGAGLLAVAAVLLPAMYAFAFWWVFLMAIAIMVRLGMIG